MTEIRRATPDDARAIGEVHVRAWLAAYTEILLLAFYEARGWTTDGGVKIERHEDVEFDEVRFRCPL